MHQKNKHMLLSALIVLSCALAFPVMGLLDPPRKPQRRDFVIRAKQYAYDPYRLIVNQGDEVHITLGAVDVVHGFYLEGYDIEAEIHPGRLPFKLRHPSKEKEFALVDELVFTAHRKGKFRYRCSVTCGSLHPFMLGELIVRPNHLFHAGFGATIGVLFAAFFLMFNHARRGDVRNAPAPWRLDLLSFIPGLRWLVTRRWLQFVVVLPTLALFVLFLIAGFFGSPIGNRNIIITFVWIFWWFLLITLLLPFGARLWCLLCPFPILGEWFQRGRFLGPPADNGCNSSMRGLNKKWPRPLANIWLQNILFLCMCTFSSILVTRPFVTAVALSILIVTATIMHMVYTRRTFCLYICPMSGFLSLYAMTSMVEIRPKNPQQAKTCRDKAGILGNGDGWACPWHQRPNKLNRNNYCGFCMECIKACPHDNMTIFARPFCSDDRIEKYDEAWKAFIMITLAMVYSVVLLGPWGTLKEWANISEMGNWPGFSLYIVMIWGVGLVGVPLFWWLAATLGQRLSGHGDVLPKTLFLRYSYLLVPLGLIAWIVFSFPLIMINGTYILTSVSDPMGWGWDLFGTAHIHWHPLIPEYIVYLQIPLLLFGLGYTLKRGYLLSLQLYSDAVQGVRSLIPFGLLCTAVTLIILTLYTG
ncbi:hypothetical protein [Desulfoluna limicola]|nr:hypothetical protein [Desulfoluna limicola]